MGLNEFRWDPLSVAPMVGYTHRHGRFMFRLLAPRAQLFTEMLVDNAILNGRRKDMLQFHSSEHPIIAQLAGSNPANVAQAAQQVESAGFDAINLNVGCPSGKVIKGGFGACLFERPDCVANIVKSIRDRVSLPVSIKCRLGTESTDGYKDFRRFVETGMQAGVRDFIVHARIAVLEGLNTSQNLSIPPLNYDDVKRLKDEMPFLHIVLNGGLADYSQVENALKWADGVMLGRLALKNPRALFEISNRLNGTNEAYQPFKLIRAYCEYMNRALLDGVHDIKLIQPLLNLFNGWPGSKKYRRHLSQNVMTKTPLVKIVSEACNMIVDAEAINVQTNQNLLFG